MGKKKSAPPAEMVRRISFVVLTEVDRTFYELQITDIRGRIEKYKSREIELTTRNEELEKLITALSLEQKDTVNFYKRIINSCNQEILELNEKIMILKEDNDSIVCENTIQKMKEEYKATHESLVSEIKSLNGKLSSLEEFKLQKDELIKKYDIQQRKVEENEIRHKREMYETKKKFTIGKDKLKQEMESNLMQLSTDFQEVTAARITPTTHRIIRENIAIKNDMELLVETNNRLFNENANLKNTNQALISETSSHKKEQAEAIKKSFIQLKVISTLTQQHKKLSEELEKYKNVESDVVDMRRELEVLLSKKDKLKQQTRILEQNLHASKCDQSVLQTELQYASSSYNNILYKLCESIMAIKEFLKKNSAKQITNKKLTNFLKKLLLVMSAEEQKITRPSLESIKSLSSMYREGDLGFEPISVALRSTCPVKHSKEVETGPSLEEFVKERIDALKDEHAEQSFKKDKEEYKKLEEEKKRKQKIRREQEEEGEEEEEQTIVQKESILFKDSGEFMSLSISESSTTSKTSDDKEKSSEELIDQEKIVTEETPNTEEEEEEEVEEEEEEEEDQVSVELLENIFTE